MSSVVGSFSDYVTFYHFGISRLVHGLRVGHNIARGYPGHTKIWIGKTQESVSGENPSGPETRR